MPSPPVPPPPSADAAPGGSQDAIDLLIAQAQSAQGDDWNHVYTALYRELRELARLQIAQQRAGNTRSPTSLVNRAWLRVSQAAQGANDREHLIRLLAKSMRYALIDEARMVMADKRGKGMAKLPIDEVRDELPQAQALEELFALDQALETLGRLDPRLGRVVELRYFGGLTNVEVAEALGVDPRTVRRDWRRARAILNRLLGGDGLVGDGDGADDPPDDR